MAHKTFISYKYGDGTTIRDKIIKALRTDASYYQGEHSASPDMGDLKTETIKKNLSDMIFDTSVMIVVISRNIDQSKWVTWEINYATGCQTRNSRQSQPDGIVIAIEDCLLDDNGRYTPNQTTRLIQRKSDPYVVTVSGLLSRAQECIEDAFQKAQKRSG